MNVEEARVRFSPAVQEIIDNCMIEDKFIDKERIDAGYKCEGCKKSVTVEKDITLYRLPKLLVIHLKRFYHSAMRREKLNTLV